MIKKIIYTLVVVASVACGMRPSGIMSDTKMENLIFDLTIGDAVLQTHKINSQEQQKEYYDFIYSKNEVSKEQFEKSLEWYAYKPKKLEQIYTNVKNRIDTLKSDVELYKFHPEAKLLDELKALDTLQIYHFAHQYTFTSTPKADSLRFEVADKNYFALSDRLILRFLMKIDDIDTISDTLQDARVEFKITYSDSSVKELYSKVFANGKLYSYAFLPTPKENVAPISVEGNLLNSQAIVKEVKIDSVQLLRIYNAEKYPLPDSIKTVLMPKEDKQSEKKEIEQPKISEAEQEFVDIIHKDLIKLKPKIK
ncbi:hypothetical protein HW49_00765 [Porphyromonadaceae bacterium COT-184 OH4590]|nr:hypothetical protein HW49_00765 [Porphyromonadaceae bacterium COT-184 OH4590]